MRDYLVFVRAGARSLHRQAIQEDPERNWDCCVSWYAPPATREALAERYDQRGSNKYEAFAETFGDAAARAPYRYVLLLDDDVKFRPGGISELFRICERERLELSQPALHWGTHANFPATLWNPACRVRRVGFVEVMAPCFSRAALEQLLPTFGLTRSTWGIDHAWAALLTGRDGLSIVDAVRVEHTAPADPVNGPFYRLLRQRGVDPQAELAAMLARYPQRRPTGTLEADHRYRWPLPRRLNRALMWLIERRKSAWHRARLQRAAQAAAASE